MDITEIRVKLLDVEDSNLKAIASMTFDNCFVVHEIKIFERDDSFVIRMPGRKKLSTGKFSDSAHPINTETREMIDNAIIRAYKDELANPREIDEEEISD